MPRRRKSTLCAASLILPLLVVSALSVVHAGTIEGRWRLVEQTYGSDGADLAASLRLEFSRAASGLVGTVWPEDDRSAGAPWPAIFSEGKARVVVDVREIAVTATGDGVRATYAAALPHDPDAELVITEVYRVGSDNETMSGTVTVRILREGRSAGAYTLQRRFERIP